MRYLLSVDPGDPRVLQLDPKLRRAEIFEAMRGQFVLAAERRPIVVVWEDLHWVDRATEEFIATLADSLAAHRSLMILTYRPGHAPLVSDRLFHTRLTLTALSPADSLTMARGLLSADELPEALQAPARPPDGGEPVLRGGGAPLAPGDGGGSPARGTG